MIFSNPADVPIFSSKSKVRQTARHQAKISFQLIVVSQYFHQFFVMLLAVKHPREAALDAQCCASIANLGKQKAQALSTGFGSFSIAEFAEKLVHVSLYTVSTAESL